MMRTKRTTFSVNKMAAGLDENLKLNLRWRLRFQANIVRWNRCCRWEDKLLMDWTLSIRCKSLRAWVFVEALSIHPWQGSWVHEAQEALKHPTSTIQVYIFGDQVCSNLLWSILWVANTWRSLLQHSSGLYMWRSSTEYQGPWEERRTKKHRERLGKT